MPIALGAMSADKGEPTKPDHFPNINYSFLNGEPKPWGGLDEIAQKYEDNVAQGRGMQNATASPREQYHRIRHAVYMDIKLAPDYWKPHKQLTKPYKDKLQAAGQADQQAAAIASSNSSGGGTRVAAMGGGLARTGTAALPPQAHGNHSFVNVHDQLGTNPIRYKLDDVMTRLNELPVLDSHITRESTMSHNEIKATIVTRKQRLLDSIAVDGVLAQNAVVDLETRDNTGNLLQRHEVQQLRDLFQMKTALYMAHRDNIVQFCADLGITYT